MQVALPIRRAYTVSLSAGPGRHKSPLAHLPNESPQCSPSRFAHVRQQAHIPGSSTSSQSPVRRGGQVTLEHAGQLKASRAANRSSAAISIKLVKIVYTVRVLERSILTQNQSSQVLESSTWQTDGETFCVADKERVDHNTD